MSRNGYSKIILDRAIQITKTEKRILQQQRLKSQDESLALWLSLLEVLWRKALQAFRDRHVVTQKRGKSNVKSKSEKQTWEIHWMSMFSSVTGKDKEIDLRHKEWRQGIRKIMNSFWLGWTLADCEALMKKGRSRRYEYSDSNWNCSGKWHYSEIM